MAYTDDQYRAQVRGSFENGEVFSNTWSFIRSDPDASVLDAIEALHAAYASIFELDISSHTTCTGATFKNLGTGVVTEGDWSIITGDDLADLLPTSCAWRISLSANPNIHGGPFISGWSVNAVDANGDLLSANQTGLVDAVTALETSLSSSDWHIGIDRPTVPTVVDASQVRVGRRADVIRKRTNDLSEAYATGDLT